MEGIGNLGFWDLWDIGVEMVPGAILRGVQGVGGGLLV